MTKTTATRDSRAQEHSLAMDMLADYKKRETWLLQALALALGLAYLFGVARFVKRS